MTASTQLNPARKSKRVLLVISGGIAAYKSLDVIRLLTKAGVQTEAVLTNAAKAFVTPLSVGALTGNRVHDQLLDLTAENEMGHIELSRSADLILAAPATANLIAKMAHGICDDLASTLLLATDKPVLVAPAMNVRMWHHPATQRNLALIAGDGATMIGPDEGDMACGDYGLGRMSEPHVIVAEVLARLGASPAAHNGSGQERRKEGFGEDRQRDLLGYHVLVTAGPTHEPLDPVRYLANRSSGKQGYAIARAARAFGARVTLISGPVDQPAPADVDVVRVETALQMRDATLNALPADIAIMTAAVADWRVETPAKDKLKKTETSDFMQLKLVENPDILRNLCELPRDGNASPTRPRLVVGFAAETRQLRAHAADKLQSKGCDWIIANDVSADNGIDGGVMGSDENAVLLVTSTGSQSWPKMAKQDVAFKLMEAASSAIRREMAPATEDV